MKGERSSEIQAPTAIWHQRRTEQYVEEANREDAYRLLLISSCNRFIMNNAGQGSFLILENRDEP